MKEVVCWCCEYFAAKYDDPVFRELITKSICTFRLKTCHSEDSVCEDFKILSGLHTERTIPERCKNYHKK